MLESITTCYQQGTVPNWAFGLGIVAYAGFEWYLPRTERFKANSGGEALGNIAKKLLLNRLPGLGKLVEALATKEDPAIQPLPIGEGKTP